MSNELEKLADTYYEQGNFLEAEQLYKRLLIADNGNKKAIYKLGYINVLKLDWENAEIILDAGLKTGLDIDGLELLALVKERRFKFYDAIVMYEQVLELQPKEALYEIIGNLYIQLELYDNALSIAKDYVEKYESLIAYRRLFLMYLNFSKHEELKELCRVIKEKFPNKGLAFNLIGMYKEFIELDYNSAEQLYEKALKTGSITAGFDLALCYKKQGRFDDAEKLCKKISDSYPRKADVYSLLTEMAFTQKKMRKGYKYYLERPLNNDVKSLKNKWDGKSYLNDILMVYCDTNDINTIRSLRYLNCLKSRFKDIILATSLELEPFLISNGIKTIKRSEVFNTAYDKYVLITELPYYLNMTFENIPKFLLSSSAKELTGEFKVGLLWKPQGDTLRAINQQTIDLTKFLNGLFEIDGVEYYSFQTNDIFNTLEIYPQINDLSDKIDNLEICAEYINSMDLIISIDSPVLHLAGVLDVPAVAVLPFDSEWYWFNNDKKTEWYSSIEVMRQSINEDWTRIAENIIKRVKHDKYKKVK